jgi:hypothetical protein
MSWRLHLAVIVLAISSAVVGAGSGVAAASSGSGIGADNPPWVRDTVNSLDIFLPDGASDYFFNGYSTINGAHTVISGRVPRARYWSITAYPSQAGMKVVHAHDTEIAHSHGRYRVLLAASCVGVRTTCLKTDSQGVVVLRLYVPVDLSTSGTGGVPLPTISYVSRSGSPETLLEASSSPALVNGLESEYAKQGTLPAVLTRSYPAPAPVPVAVMNPIPVATEHPPVQATETIRSSGRVGYGNPDNLDAREFGRDRPCPHVPSECFDTEPARSAVQATTSGALLVALRLAEGSIHRFLSLRRPGSHPQRKSAIRDCGGTDVSGRGLRELHRSRARTTPGKLAVSQPPLQRVLFAGRLQGVL